MASANFMDGYAFKRGRVVKNWKRRYFSLNSSGLNYYKSKSFQNEKLGGCALHKLAYVEKVDDFDCPHPGYTLLVVMGRQRNLYMQLCSEEERNNWCKAIHNIVSGSNNTASQTNLNKENVD